MHISFLLMLKLVFKTLLSVAVDVLVDGAWEPQLKIKMSILSEWFEKWTLIIIIHYSYINAIKKLKWQWNGKNKIELQRIAMCTYFFMSQLWCQPHCQCQIGNICTLNPFYLKKLPIKFIFGDILVFWKFQFVCCIFISFVGLNSVNARSYSCGNHSFDWLKQIRILLL